MNSQMYFIKIHKAKSSWYEWPSSQFRQINWAGYAHHIFTRPFKFSGLPPSAIPFTLESGVDVGQGINVGQGKFAKKNKCRASEF
jgi:hypothetical protein